MVKFKAVKKVFLDGWLAGWQIHVPSTQSITTFFLAESNH
jgi:hypothetical protein